MSEPDELLARAVSGAKVTREVIVAPRALDAVARVAATHWPGQARLVVADPCTLAAAGAAVHARLSAGGGASELLVLDERPRLKPDARRAREIAARLGGAVVPVAVGSGVVNDLVKYAASLASRPYLSVPTAASMDGYAASGAALLDDGFKRTFASPPPLAIVVDTGVLAAAPPAMASWGYGDLLGKIVAGADWILADALGEEAIDPAPFRLVQDHLPSWLSESGAIPAGDPDALRRLASGLLICGFAMQAHGNSRPASGSEHQFSHLWEMEGLTVDGTPAAHGACVGVGCIAMLALYDRLLARDVDRALIERALARHAPIESADRAVEIAFPAGRLRERARDEVRAKWPSKEALEARLVRACSVWPDLRRQLSARLPAASVAQGWLRAAGAASDGQALGVDAAKLAADYRRARLIRRRYTALDLLFDLGCLDDDVGALFAPGGFWGADPGPDDARPRSGSGFSRSAGI